MTRTMPSQPRGELLVDYTSPKGAQLLAVRGVMLLSHAERLREFGHYERFIALLPAAARERVPYITAMSWVDVALAGTFYSACDGLSLPDAEAIQLGGRSATAIGPAMLGTLLRAAGMSPLTALGALGRVWDRIHEGGACVALQTGPKDLILEQRGNPLASSPFYRLSGQGFYKFLAELFCSTAYVRAAASLERRSQSFTVEISWA